MHSVLLRQAVELNKGRVAFILSIVVLLAFSCIPTRVSASVEVSSFTATAQANDIIINWKTVSELQVASFDLQRSTSQGGPYSTIYSAPAKYFGTPIGGDYPYTDTDVAPGQKVFYRLQTVRPNGAADPDFNGPVSATVGGSTTTPTATKTPVPTSTPTKTPAPSSTPTSTPIVPATSTPTLLASSTFVPTPGQTAVATPPARVAFAVQPSPTRARLGSPAVATPTSGNLGAPTPGPTWVAMLVEEPTTEGSTTDVQDASELNPQDTVLDRSYYLNRLMNVSIFFAAGSMLFGSFVLGLIALFLFLRAYLR